MYHDVACSSRRFHMQKQTPSEELVQDSPPLGIVDHYGRPIPYGQ